MNPKIHKSVGVVFFAILLCLVFSLRPAMAQDKMFGLSFKLGGGAGLLLNGGGDIENYRLGRQGYTEGWGSRPYYSSTFNWNKWSMVPNFEADVILTFGRSFGFGIGSGYVGGTAKGDYGLGYYRTTSVWWGTYTNDWEDMYTQEFKVGAVPIRFTFYYFLPLSTMDFYAFAGMGYYLGNMTRSENYEYQYDYSDDSWYYWNEKYQFTLDYDYTETMKSNALGFHGGLGLMMNLSRNFGISLELLARFVNFNKWEGDWDITWNGTERAWHELVGWYYNQTFSGSDSGSNEVLWYYEYYNSTLNDQFANMYLYDTKPTGSNYRNVREAAINLNAFGIAVTVFIRLF